MLATYKGKEYYCKILSRDRVILYSKKHEEGMFEPGNIHREIVNKNQCDEIKKGCMYAYYDEQEIEIANVDMAKGKFLVWTGSTHRYNDVFIKNVLEGKEGRDIFAWCDIDKFDKYSMYTEKIIIDEDEKNIDKMKLFIPVKQVVEYIYLINNY